MPLPPLAHLRGARCATNQRSVSAGRKSWSPRAAKTWVPCVTGIAAEVRTSENGIHPEGFRRRDTTLRSIRCRPDPRACGLHLQRRIAPAPRPRRSKHSSGCSRYRHACCLLPAIFGADSRFGLGPYPVFGRRPLWRGENSQASFREGKSGAPVGSLNSPMRNPLVAVLLLNFFSAKNS